MKYIANPVEVDAFVIESVNHPDERGKTLLGLTELGTRYTTSDMTARMNPKVGDYFVVQSDGYADLNPKEVFERKYSPKP